MNSEIKEYLEPGKKNIILVYVLYLLGSIITVLPIIGVAFAFVHMRHKNKIWQSHYHFAFRTFTLGVAAIIVSIIISFIFMSISIFFMGFMFYIAIFIWFVLRSIIAINYVINDLEHPNPNTFGIK